jgi:predicted HTH domain antitoxin
MTQFTLNVPDDVARAVAATADGVAAEVRLMAALKLFELGRLSSGQAAQLADQSRLAFLDACARYGVPAFNYGDDRVVDELERDVNTLRSRQL